MSSIFLLILTFLLFSAKTLATPTEPKAQPPAMAYIGGQTASEVHFTDGETVFGLFHIDGTKNESEVKKVKVAVKMVKNELHDSEEEKSDKEIKIDESLGHPYLLVRDNLKVGRFKLLDSTNFSTCKADEIAIYPFENNSEVSEVNQKLTKLRVELTNLVYDISSKKGFKNFREKTCPTPGYEQNKVVTTVSGFNDIDSVLTPVIAISVTFEGITHKIDGVKKIEWAGDINGDGILDFLVRNGFHYAGDSEQLYISEKNAANKTLYKAPIDYSFYGC